MSKKRALKVLIDFMHKICRKKSGEFYTEDIDKHTPCAV